MQFRTLKGFTAFLLLFAASLGCGDESDSDEAAGDSTGSGELSTWEKCEARGFKGACRGTVCNEYFGEVDVADLQSSCEGIKWSWSNDRCSLGETTGWCTIQRDAGCQIQTYESIGVAEPLCGAYDGEYTPPPE